MPKEPKKLFFKHIVRKLFLEDWGLKLFALVITVGLWFGVTGLSTPSDRRLDVPFNLYISNNAEVTNAIPQDINIVISGDKRKIDQIKQTDLVAALDLSDRAPGDYSVTLSPDNINVQLPLGVKLSQVSPNRIPINIEAVEEKDVDVRIETSGTPSAGYEVYNSNAVPSRIRVRGPASFMKSLEFVQTASIDITGRASEFTAKQIPVTVSNPKASVLNTVVDVYFRIGEKRFERSFLIPVSPGKAASFTIFGPKTLVSKARADSFKVEIDKGEIGEEIPRLVMPAELQDVVEVRNLMVK
jgi:YbbR domain-containing protein